MKTRAQVLEERTDREIDQMIAAKLASAKLAAPINPHARIKLRGILKKYARSAHPFTECVRDTTPVETADGAVAIKDLAPGDLVWSFNGKSFELKPVVWSGGTRRGARVMKLMLEDGAEIVATPDHKFMRKDGSWAELQELQSGDLLRASLAFSALSRARLAVALAGADASSDEASVLAPEVTTRAGDCAARFDGGDTNLEGVVSVERLGDLDLPTRRHQGQHSAHNRRSRMAVDTPFPLEGVMGDLARSRRADVSDSKDRPEPLQRFGVDLGSDNDEVGGAQPVAIASLGRSAVPPEASFAFEESSSPSEAYSRQVLNVFALEERENTWDIEVESNHNFVVLGAVAHNCVRDNLSRFGPGRTEAVCATLKDVIKGNKDWRKGSSHTSESDAVIDADVLLALDAISEIDLQEIFLEARALDEYGTVEATALLNVTGKSEFERWGGGVEAIQLAEIGLATLDAKKRAQLKSDDFALPPDGYPMHDRQHAVAALARAKQHASPAEYQTIKARVCKRYSDLPVCKEN